MEPLSSRDPKRLGEFTLQARLGSGGMGRVYLGRSPGGMQVAIKVIREDLAGDADVLARFRREVATVRAVRSPYTARLVDACLDAPPFWLATEFVPGPTLLVASRGAPMEPALCRGVFAALAEALAAVHRHGVVHRDVKPHNVILAPGGPQLIDFGIARAAEHTQLTRTGQLPGTPGYTAPEVLMGNEAGPAADVFSLGATMAAAATGRPPYGGGEWAAVSYRVVHGEIDVDGVESGLAELIRQCVAREPAGRPDPLEIVRRCGVTGALAEFPHYQRLAGEAPTLVPPRRRRVPWPATAALAVGGLGLATLGWLLLPQGGDNAGARDSPTKSATACAAKSTPRSPAGSGSGGQGGRKSLTVGIMPHQPGLSVCAPDGDYVGFEVDIAWSIARELGVDVKDITWREVSAAERTSVLADGKVDFLVASYEITDEREAQVDFAGPYLSTRQDLLIRADDRVPDRADLDDMTLCSVTGTTSAQAIRKNVAPGVKLKEYTSYPRCLTALDKGHVDAVTAEDAHLAGQAAWRGFPHRYRMVGLKLGAEHLYAVGLPQGETELRNEINAVIEQMYTNGAWQASVERFLAGVDNYEPTPPGLSATSG
ncbi:serine/threonine-protein kinase [Streptomyces sp. WMMC500]|uniref:serine/threonine-protein kinase n=1 Tax=Streptomyces sp. WMMC500 TaxID=3015154 RepID=UPI00248C962C|nr:serine/threonine-protein kinase [Streptomyces sp. WMMC500]WBB63995.1 serine/threonine-protein kinase [Streptomyces sp. WMMC500]